MPRWIELFVVALLCLVAFEVGDYNARPAPVKPAPRELPRFDPTMAPKEMSAKCRAEGKQLIATQADGVIWGFDCVEAKR